MWNDRARRPGPRLRSIPRRARLRSRPGAEALELRSLLAASMDITSLTALRNDPSFAAIDGILGNGTRVGVAVIDSGVVAAHPDLRPNFVAYYDAITQQASTNVGAAIDPNGHGTHVSGTVLGRNREIGVAPQAGLIGVRGLPSDNERPQFDTVGNALQWVLDNASRYNIRVVNMSLGFPDINTNTPRNDGRARLIDQLEEQGVTVVSASGNNYGNFAALGSSTPGSESTITVASTWSTRTVLSSPQYGGNPTQNTRFVSVEREGAPDRLAASSQRSTLSSQLAAPGVNIVSARNSASGGYTTMSGTSMASPFIAGVVALMQDAAQTFGNRYLIPSQVVSILRESADRIVDANVSSNGRAPLSIDSSGRLSVDPSAEQNLPETGQTFLRVNVLRAIQRVRALVSTGSTPTTPRDTNNTRETAVVVPSFDGNRAPFTFDGRVGTDGSSRPGVNDVDLFKIVLDSPGTISFRTDPISGGAPFDSYLRLFNSAGSQIAANNDGPNGQYALLTSQRLAAGTYYFGVSSFNNSAYAITNGSNAANGRSEGDYRLTVSFGNPDPNGVTTGAVELTPAQAAAPINGDIGSDPPPAGSAADAPRVQIGASDVDMFSYVATDDGLLTIDVDAFVGTGFPNPVDAFIRVFDANVQQIAAVDDDPGFLSGQQPSPDSFLQIPLAKGQRIFISIADFSNRDFNPLDPYDRSAQGTGGLYRMKLLFDNGDRNGSAFSAASTIPIGQEAVGTIGTDFGGPIIGRDGSLDVDWFAFTPDRDGLVQFDVSPREDLINGLGTVAPQLSLWRFNNPQNPTDIIKIADTTSTGLRLLNRVTAGVPIFVAVTGEGNGGFQWFATATGSGGDTGGYTLRTAYPDNSAERIAGNDDLSNFSGQTSLAVGRLYAEELGRDGILVGLDDDVDLFRFVPTATRVYEFLTSSTNSLSANTVLRLFDASGRQIALNDDAGPTTRNSRIRTRLIAGQTYFVGVSGSGNTTYTVGGSGTRAGSTGDYALSVNITSATPGDYDGDGKADPTVFQPSTSTFAIMLSAGGTRLQQFGRGQNGGGTPIPLPADYDGDGRADLAVFEPSTATFFIQNSAGGSTTRQFGPGRNGGGDPVPLPADYDGDGKADIAVFEPSTATFFFRFSSNNATRTQQFGRGRNGGGNPIPLPADYDGDGKADIAVYQPDTSTFFLAMSGGTNQTVQFGQGRNNGGTPIPVPADFDGDGKADVAVFDPRTATFYVQNSAGGTTIRQFGQGRNNGGDPVPLRGDFDGDSRVDMAVYQPGTSTFGIRYSSGLTPRSIQFGQGRNSRGNPTALPSWPITFTSVRTGRVAASRLASRPEATTEFRSHDNLAILIPDAISNTPVGNTVQIRRQARRVSPRLDRSPRG